jgi:hypothetical protein
MSLVNSNPLILAAGGDYQISRSVRLRNSASAYFSRTPGSAGNQQRFTFSFWAKRGAFTTTTANDQVFFGVNYTGTNIFTIAIPSGASENLRILNYTSGSMNLNLTTSQVFRDPSSWYHFVVAIDTTQATSSNRALLYVNGQQVTAFSTATYPAQNANLQWNVTQAHGIGRESTGSYYDGYLTEINFIDGQALTPSSFGETNPITGVWQPKKYTGTYGTNGFFLTFQDNSAATATTIGKDYSGNGNNWTPNNISVTAGVTYDSMLDVPTIWGDGGNGRGNYCVLNPLSTAAFTISNANLNWSITSSASNALYLKSTLAVSSGKWYWEVTPTDVGGGPNLFIGIQDSTYTPSSAATDNVTSGYAYKAQDGNKVTGATSTSYGASYTNNDVIGVALDMDAGTLVFYKNNTSQGTAFSGLSGSYLPLLVHNVGGVSRTTAGSVNYGQRPFTYTPPTGFRALNTQNLPEPVIKNGAAWMAATLYTGTNASLTISNAVNGVSMQPDLVWVKVRSQADQNVLCDAVRGVTRRLYSNLTNAEDATGGLVSINSSGFVLGDAATSQSMNNSGQTYVAWQWKANGTPAVTNTAGSITSTVSASTTSGFSVVTYTGNGSSGATIGHGLGVAPRMIIVKSRSSVTNWRVGHSSLPSWTNFLQLDATNAQGSNNVIFNGTAPTSTVFTVGNDSSVNSNGSTYVAYCFAPIAGFSAFGGYTGNGSSSGPFVYLGFRPEYIMIKRTDTTASWLVVDAARSPDNTSVNGGMKNVLFPNLSNAEDTGADICDGVSNGFRFYQGAASFNANGGTYIYMAFSQNPFKYALAR